MFSGCVGRYNFFTPGVYELFAHEMRASQESNSSSEYRGFIRGVVPGRTNGPPSKGNASDPFPGDISWTAAWVDPLLCIDFTMAPRLD
jgi:hypothetical protein